jgi:hypothetical protein
MLQGFRLSLMAQHRMLQCSKRLEQSVAVLPGLPIPCCVGRLLLQGEHAIQRQGWGSRRRTAGPIDRNGHSETPRSVAQDCGGGRRCAPNTLDYHAYGSIDPVPSVLPGK